MNRGKTEQLELYKIQISILWASMQRLSVRSFYTFISKYDLLYMFVLKVEPHQSKSISALSHL